MTGLEPLMVAAIVSAAGAGVSAVGGMQQAAAVRSAGRAQQQEMAYRAEQANVAAGQELASTQRAQSEERRKKGLVLSRAQNIAAASGGTLDTSLVDIMGALEQEGEHRSDLIGYEGASRASKLTQQSGLLDYQGEQAWQAARQKSGAMKTKVAGDLVSTAASLYGKYGGGGAGDMGGSVPIPSRKPIR